MQLKKNLLRQLKAIPILYLMIVLIWMLVFAAVAYRYFHGSSISLKEDASLQTSGDKDYLNSSTIKSSYLDSEFINNLAKDTQDQLLNEKSETLENIDLQFNTLYTELGAISSVLSLIHI
jgi:flagellar basal body-associated protein FliL